MTTFAGPETEHTVAAISIMVGDKVYDPIKSGTHGQRVEVQWIGVHTTRNRIYVAGLEERSRNPVTLAYDNHETVKIYR